MTTETKKTTNREKAIRHLELASVNIDNHGRDEEDSLSLLDWLILIGKSSVAWKLANSFKQKENQYCRDSLIEELENLVRRLKEQQSAE